MEGKEILRYIKGSEKLNGLNGEYRRLRMVKKNRLRRVYVKKKKIEIEYGNRMGRRI